MHESTTAVSHILPNQLDALFAQAHAEVWTELVLLGPSVSISSDEEFPRHRRVYQLGKVVSDLEERIGRLTNLTSLVLKGCGVDDTGGEVLGGCGVRIPNSWHKFERFPSLVKCCALVTMIQ